jgi:LPXTG-motif cell wall-anchored protein
MKRTLAILALTGSLAMLSGGAAMATTYPPQPPGVGVSDGTITPGKALVFSGKGFKPGERVIVNVSPVGRAGSAPGITGSAPGLGGRSVPTKIMPVEITELETVADSEGNFSLPVTLSEAGVYTLTATGETSGLTHSATVTVVEAATPAATIKKNGGLAETGANSDLYLWGGIGAAALIAGATSVVVVRRKTAREAS